ncbi:MAG: hypothetical protein ABSG53_19230 [Thermoguttaceae bacterium]|jgi:hypothetical protein
MKTIAGKNSQNSHVPTGATPAPPDKVLTQVPNGTPAATADPPVFATGLYVHLFGR